MTNKQTLNRISENNFHASYTAAESSHALITQGISGIFQLSLFACYQILSGGMNAFSDLEGFQTGYVTALMKKLGLHAIKLGSVENPDIELDRNEVELLRILLSARIRHCEIQRDNLDPQFNPDTYISQKLLLLDIREWLMVHSIAIDPNVYAVIAK